MSIAKTLAYIGATTYSLTFTFLALITGFLACLVATVIGVFILSFISKFITFYEFLAFFSLLTVLLVIYEVLGSTDIGKLKVRSYTYYPHFIEYIKIVTKLIDAMGIHDEIYPCLTFEYPVAAFVSKLGYKRNVLVIGELIMEFPLDEATAIIAHELAHIKHGDLILSSLIDLPHKVTRKFLGILKKFLGISVELFILWPAVPIILIAFLLLIPIYALTTVISRAVSRVLESRADEEAIKYVDPESLARALVRYEELIKILLNDIMRGVIVNPRIIPVNPYTYIKNMKLRFWEKLYYMFLSTHPPITKRVKKILEKKNK